MNGQAQSAGYGYYAAQAAPGYGYYAAQGQLPPGGYG